MKKLLLFSLFALLASAMGWAATETWVKVTSTPDSWDGDYLIVYEGGNLAFNGSAKAIKAKGQTNINVTISDKSITTTDCNFFFTIKETATSGQYTITSNSGLCIGTKQTSSSSTNDITTGDFKHTLSIDNSGNAIITCTGDRVLRYNKTQPRFCYYKSGQQPIALYKKSDAPATKVAPLEISPAFGDIAKGTQVTISCATEGAVLNGMIGDTNVTNAALPYTYTADKEGPIHFYLCANKGGYAESDILEGDFIVKAAVPVAYRDVITAEDYTVTSSYTELSLEKTGAKYSSKAYLNKENSCLQFNNSNKQKAGIVMKESKAFVSKIIITWNIQGTNTNSGFEIYGKNSPYEVAADLYNTTKAGTLIGSYAWTEKDGVTEIDLTGKPFTFIGVKPTGVTYINSIEFIWNESEAGNADVTYTKASEAKAGNFAVLATAEGKAIGRNADLNPEDVTVSDDAIGLNKNQPKVDEFEIVEKDAANNIYQLCGGLSSDNSRRFLTYDADGVTTTAATVTKVDGKDVVSTADANADVTFESTAAGLLVKFNDGEYLMFNGTNFVKGEYTEVATQADGETLTPVIVFLSSSNVSTGVETVEFDENAAVQYFNLNGVQVKAENLTPGLYIVRQGNKVSKQVIR